MNHDDGDDDDEDDEDDNGDHDDGYVFSDGRWRIARCSVADAEVRR